MSIFTAILALYIIVSMIVMIIISSSMPDIEHTFIQNILRWNNLNLFGKIVLIICIIPMDTIVISIYSIIFIFTWHPRKKK